MMEYDEDNIGDESVFENKRCVKFVSSPQFMSPKRKFNSSIIDLNLTDNGTPKAVIRDKFQRMSIALTSREVELDRERQARFDLEREHQELQEFTRLESEAGVDEERRMSVASSGSESDLLDRMKWLEKSYKDGENMNLQLGKSLSESKQECNHLKLVVEDLRKNLTDVTETEEKGSIRLIELEPLVEEVKQLREKTHELENHKMDFEMQLELAVQKKETTIVDLRKYLDSAFEEIATLESGSKVDVRSRFEKIKEVNQKVQELEVENKRKDKLVEEAEVMKDEFDNFKEGMEVVTNQMEKLSEEKIALEDEVKSLRMSSVNGENPEFIEKLNKQETENARLEDMLKSRNAEISNLELSNASLLETVDELSRKTDEIDQKNSELLVASAEMERFNVELKEEITQLKMEVKEVVEFKDKLELENQELKSEVEEVTTSKTNLEEFINRSQNTDEVEEMKKEMKQMEEDKSKLEAMLKNDERSIMISKLSATLNSIEESFISVEESNKTCADESPSNATFANTTLGVPLEVVEEMKNQLLFLQQQLINFSPEELERKVLEIEELKAENSKLMLKLPSSEKLTADLDKVLEEKAEELKSKHKAELAIVTTKTREEMNFNLATLEEKLRDEFEEKKLEATKDITVKYEDKFHTMQDQLKSSQDSVVDLQEQLKRSQESLLMVTENLSNQKNTTLGVVPLQGIESLNSTETAFTTCEMSFDETIGNSSMNLTMGSNTVLDGGIGDSLQVQMLKGELELARNTLEEKEQIIEDLIQKGCVRESEPTVTTDESAHEQKIQEELASARKELKCKDELIEQLKAKEACPTILIEDSDAKRPEMEDELELTRKSLEEKKELVLNLESKLVEAEIAKEEVLSEKESLESKLESIDQLQSQMATLETLISEGKEELKQVVEKSEDWELKYKEALESLEMKKGESQEESDEFERKDLEYQETIKKLEKEISEFDILRIKGEEYIRDVSMKCGNYEEMEEKYHELEDRNEEINKKLEENVVQFESLNSNIENQNLQIKSLEELAESKSEELEKMCDLKDENGKLQMKIQEITESFALVKSDLSLEVEKLEGLKNDLKIAEETISEMEIIKLRGLEKDKSLEEARSQLKDSEELRASKEKVLCELQSDLKEVENEKICLVEDFKKTRDNLEDATEKNRNLEEGLENAMADLESAIIEKETTQEEISQYEVKLSEMSNLVEVSNSAQEVLKLALVKNSQELESIKSLNGELLKTKTQLTLEIENFAIDAKRFECIKSDLEEKISKLEESYHALMQEKENEKTYYEKCLQDAKSDSTLVATMSAKLMEMEAKVEQEAASKVERESRFSSILDNLKDEKTNLEKHLNSKEADFETKLNEKEALLAKISEEKLVVEEQVLNLKFNADKTATDLNLAQEKVTLLESDLKAKSQEIVEVEAQLKSKLKTLEETKSSSDVLQQEVLGLKKELEMTRGEVMEVEKQRDGVNDECDKLEAKLVDTEERLKTEVQRSAHVAELETKIASLNVLREGNLQGLEENKRLQEQLESTLAEVTEVEKQRDSVNDECDKLGKIKQALEKENDALNSKVGKINSALEKSELHKDSLLTEIKTLQFQKDKCEKVIQDIEAKLLDQEKTKVSLAEMEELKRKLQFSISNAKRLEKEHDTTEGLLVASEEVKAALKTSSARLLKQLELLRKDVDRFAREAEQASSSPWTSEEWEGLTSLEMFNMMKGELVPAQQARLATMAIEELEKELGDGKTDFLRVVEQLQEVKKEKTKLEAKVCFLENVPISSIEQKDVKSMPAPAMPGTSRPTTATAVAPVKSIVSKSLIAPAKLSKSTKHEIPGVRPFTPKSLKTVSKLSRSSRKNSSNISKQSKDSSNISDVSQSSSDNSSLRRSSRSASKLANLSLCKTTQSTTTTSSSSTPSPPSVPSVTSRRIVPLPSVWEREGVLADSIRSNTSQLDNSAFTSQQSGKRSCSTSSQETDMESEKKKQRIDDGELEYGCRFTARNNVIIHRSDSATPALTAGPVSTAASIIRPAKLSTAPAQEEDAGEASEDGSEAGR